MGRRPAPIGDTTVQGAHKETRWALFLLLGRDCVPPPFSGFENAAFRQGLYVSSWTPVWQPNPPMDKSLVTPVLWTLGGIKLLNLAVVVFL